MFLLYFVLWLIFVGTITVESCIIGLIVAAVIFMFTCKFLDYSLELEKNNLKKIPKMIKYIYMLVKEIVKANVAVIRLIISEKEEVEPVLVSFKGKAKTKAGRALYANAITLTPGTITVYLDDDKYIVHALDEKLADGIDDTRLEKLIVEMEKGEEQ